MWTLPLDPRPEQEIAVILLILVLYAIWREFDKITDLFKDDPPGPHAQ